MPRRLAIDAAAQGFLQADTSSNMPEARLAREAEIACATLALATDWDCWHPHQACVMAELAIANLQGNAQTRQTVGKARCKRSIPSSVYSPRRPGSTLFSESFTLWRVPHLSSTLPEWTTA